VQVEWSCDGAGHIQQFTLSQKDVLGKGGIWPIATQILLSYPSGPPATLRAQLDTEKIEVKEALGKPCPQYVFANDHDYAYGRFLLDSRSRAAAMEKLADVKDIFQRTLLWGSLWDSVREAELAPREFLDLALRLLPSEQDEALAQNLIGHVITGLHRYVSASTRSAIVPKAEPLAADRMMHAPEQDLRIIWFRALRGVAETETARARMKELLSGKTNVPGVELRPLDRWSMVTALIALNDQEADSVYAAEQKRDNTGDGQKY